MCRFVACVISLAALLTAAPGAFAAHSELLARWHLDGDGGSTPDDSGHDLTGDMSGGATFAAGGRFGNALDLDNSGGDSQVDVQDNAVLEPAQVTVLAWVKLGTTPIGTHYVVAKGASGCSGSSYALATSGGGLAFHIHNGAQQFVSPNIGTAIWNDQWHAVAGIYDGSRVRLYVDGTQVADGTAAGGTSIAYNFLTDDMRIGNYPNANACGGGLVFGGLIDEVRVYNRALDPGEIAHLHSPAHAQPPNLPPPPSNTTAPTLSGATAEPHPGDDLTAEQGGWTRSPSDFAFQWLRCAADGGSCADIAGATGTSYRVTGDDLGKTIRARVTASNAGGSGAPAESAPTGVVTPVPLQARLTIAPNPACYWTLVLLDGRGSFGGTGGIVNYRFEYPRTVYTTFTDSRHFERGGPAKPVRVIDDVLQDGPSGFTIARFFWTGKTVDFYVPSGFGIWGAPANPIYELDPADVKLTVTDATGATAQTVLRLNPLHARSNQTANCPAGEPPPTAVVNAPPIKSVASSLAVVKRTVRATVPCLGSVNCVGAISYGIRSGSTRRLRGAASRKPTILATSAFEVLAGEKKVVTAKFTRAGRRLLRRGRRVRATLAVMSVNGTRKPSVRTRSVTLRVPR